MEIWAEANGRRSERDKRMEINVARGEANRLRQFRSLEQHLSVQNSGAQAQQKLERTEINKHVSDIKTVKTKEMLPTIFNKQC